MPSGDLDNLRDPERLSALVELGLLDTPAEAVFDRAVELATQVLGVPVGLVSLVDDHRQFFKAQVGLSEPVASGRETLLSHSFCQHVVSKDRPLIINDARDDPVLKDNLAIPDLGVIAYLGVPLHDEQGHVLGSLCAIDDKPHEWTDQDRRVLENIRTGVESEIALRAELKKRIAAEKASADAERRLQLALRAGRLGTFDFDPQTRIARWDPVMHDLWWIDPVEKNPFLVAQDRVHPDDVDIDRMAREAALDPTGDGKHEVEIRIINPKNGESRWLHLDGRVTFEEDVPVRVVGTARDVTERRSTEHRNSLLIQELDHRVKNLFAMTAGMISLTARTAQTPAAMGKALSGRVQALAMAHDLAKPAIAGSPEDGEAISLKKLLTRIMEPHVMLDREGRLKGPNIRLEPRSASSLALVFHELATNAVKYGALSSHKGRVDICWTVESGDDAVLILHWREVGGPNQKGPVQTGFGSKLIKETVTGQLLGRWSRRWEHAGLHCEISIPLRSLQN